MKLWKLLTLIDTDVKIQIENLQEMHSYRFDDKREIPGDYMNMRIVEILSKNDILIILIV